MSKVGIYNSLPKIIFCTYRMYFPTKGGAAALPSGVVPGGARDKDGNACALRESALPRHRGDAGGGQPPPPTVSLVRPTGSQEGAQWALSRDRAV